MSCAPSRSCSRPAASRPTPTCAASTSARAGSGPRCAAPRSTPATCCAPRSTPAPRRTATGRTCHSVAWDAGAADEGDRELTNRLTRGGYPLGHRGQRARAERFVDEGADFRNYTYAKYGARILDAARRRRVPALRRDHPAAAAHRGVRHARHLERRRRTRSRSSPPTSASTQSALRADRAGVQRRRSTRRCRSTRRSRTAARADVEPPKSNWAQPLETPPFYAFPVTCGITFTFGGLRADTARPGARGVGRADRRACSSAARCSAACSAATTLAAPASSRARCSAAAPGRWPDRARQAGHGEGRRRHHLRRPPRRRPHGRARPRRTGARGRASRPASACPARRSGRRCAGWSTTGCSCQSARGLVVRGIDLEEVIQTYTVRILLEGEAAAEAAHGPHRRPT